MIKRSTGIFILSWLLIFGAVACGSAAAGTSTPSPADTSSTTTASSPTPSPTAAASLTPVPPHATGVVIALNPNSLSNTACGAAINLVFNATITIAAGSTGGALPYTWTINHTSIPGSATFTAGETSKSVAYTLSNYAVQLQSASLVSGSITVGQGSGSITSSAVGVTGTCNLPGPFVVQSIILSVSPSSIEGLACGTTLTVTYTATITIGPDSNAGVVQLVWRVANSTSRATTSFAPAQTVKTITVTNTGTLVAGNSNGFPRRISLASVSPNAVSSAPVKPTGLCK
jgi:hypothetical protein